jgi:RNA polymerase sigma-70 factor (ECF subfamily)
MSEGQNEDLELRMLMTRYQDADADALDQLVRRISPGLLRYFSVSRATRHEAEDLLQNCWLRIHRSRHTYRSSEPVLPWIYGIARHTSLDAYRKRKRLESHEVQVETLPDWAGSTAPSVPAHEERLDDLIARLPESQREVIVMLKVMGMSLEEVARATSATVGAVKQKAHRAYKALRAALAKDEHAR